MRTFGSLGWATSSAFSSVATRPRRRSASTSTRSATDETSASNPISPDHVRHLETDNHFRTPASTWKQRPFSKAGGRWDALNIVDSGSPLLQMAPLAGNWRTGALEGLCGAGRSNTGDRRSAVLERGVTSVSVIPGEARCVLGKVEPRGT
eukprot:9389988-Pyramimonas_sp.AAC.1